MKTLEEIKRRLDANGNTNISVEEYETYKNHLKRGYKFREAYIVSGDADDFEYNLIGQKKKKYIVVERRPKWHIPQ